MNAPKLPAHILFFVCGVMLSPVVVAVVVVLVIVVVIVGVLVAVVTVE